jgi:hypothetical protein
VNEGEQEVYQDEKIHAPAENRTRGPTMATLDFTTKPLALVRCVGLSIYDGLFSRQQTAEGEELL